MSGRTLFERMAEAARDPKPTTAFEKIEAGLKDAIALAPGLKTDGDECPKGGRHVYFTAGRYPPCTVVRECSKCGDTYEKDVS